jgi:hypothetical protein
MLTTYNKPVQVSETVRVRFVYDEEYQSEGSYAYDTEEETAAAVKEEQDKLNSGDYVALGAIVQHKCPCCEEWTSGDSLWGIVADSGADLAKLAAEVGLDTMPKVWHRSGQPIIANP